MPDLRAEKVRQFCVEQTASRVHILTIMQPFSLSQDRFMVIEAHTGARLVVCRQCTPRTALGQGQEYPIAPATLRAFLQQLEAAEAAWADDAIPAEVHDGVTMTLEQVRADTYRRVRIVDSAVGSAPAQLVAAWRVAFPEVAQGLR